MGIIKRQSLKSSLVNYFGVGLGAIFFLLVFPNILDEKYLGFYQLILGLTLVFAQLPILGTANVLFKFFAKWKTEGRIPHFNSFALISILLGSLVFGVAYFLLKDVIISFYETKSALFGSYYFIIPPLVLIQAINHYLDSYAMMKLRVAVPTFIREIINRVFVIILLFLLAYNCLSEAQFVFLYVILFFVSLVLLIFYAIRYLEFKLGNPTLYRKNNNELKEQFSYGFNATAVNFITTSQIFADAIILPIYLGLGALGIYGRPLILGQMINIPYRSIAYIASPIIMQAWHDNDLKKIETLNKQLSINLLLIGSFLFTLIIVNADNFFNALPAIYRQGEYVLYIIAFGRLVDMSFGLNSEILFSSKYYKRIVWFTLISLCITVGLNILLIPSIGMEGAAIAVTASLVIFNIMKTALIYIKFRFHCFSKHYITLTIIAACVITIGLLIPDFKSETLNLKVGTSLASVAINTLIKSSIVTVLFIIPILYFKVSEDFSSFFNLVISGKIFKGGHKMEEL